MPSVGQWHLLPGTDRVHVIFFLSLIGAFSIYEETEAQRESVISHELTQIHGITKTRTSTVWCLQALAHTQTPLCHLGPSNSDCDILGGYHTSPPSLAIAGGDFLRVRLGS